MDFNQFKNYDWYIAVSRGGLAPTYRLSQLTGHKNIDTIVAYSYDENNQASDVTYVPKDYSHLNGKKVLLIDDLVDSGQTLEFVVNELKKFSPATLETFVVYKKEGSTFDPDYFVHAAPKDEWINFSNNLEDLF